MPRPWIGSSTASPGLLGALGLAAAARGYLLWQYYCINSDGVVYIRAAQDFFAGSVANGLQSVYPPGYPLLIAAVQPLLGDWELAGQLLSVFFGIALLLPLHWICRKMFDARVALLVCYLAAVNPLLALYSVHVRSESTYLGIAVAAFYLLVIAIEERALARFFWAGLIAGFGFLVRPEAIGFLLIVPAVLLVRWLLWREQSVVRMMQSVVLLAAGFAIFALPYIVYLSLDTGRFGAISRKAGITLAISLNELGMLDESGDGKETDVGSFVFTDYVWQNPLVYVKKVATDLLPAGWTFVQALYYSYLPFLLLGLFVGLRKEIFARSHLLLIGFVLFYVLGFALIYVKRRYAVQAVPLSLAWVALGMVFLWDQLHQRLPLSRARLAAAGIGVLFLAATLPRTLKPVSPEKAFVRQAGWYLKTRNQNGSLSVASFDERVAFYASARSIVIQPKIDGESMARALRENRADYFAAEAKVFATLWPEVSRRPELYGLVLEQHFDGTRKDRMLVFKVS
jgi:4-amino-4-deoxy-L-arabinose transferase-like glycosyltransferase